MTRFIIILFLLANVVQEGYARVNISNTTFGRTSWAQEEQAIAKQDKKDKEKTVDQKPAKPEIKQVPKSKRQVKPIAVKPNIKVKPIKIIKPKIKKP